MFQYLLYADDPPNCSSVSKFSLKLSYCQSLTQHFLCTLHRHFKPKGRSCFSSSLLYVAVFLISAKWQFHSYIDLEYSWLFFLMSHILSLSKWCHVEFWPYSLHYCQDKSPSSPGSPLSASPCPGGLYLIPHMVATGMLLNAYLSHPFSKAPVATWLSFSSDPGSHVNKSQDLLPVPHGTPLHHFLPHLCPWNPTARGALFCSQTHQPCSFL